MDSVAFAIVASEEENIRRKKETKIRRKILRDACNPFDLEDQVFKKNFRLNKRAFKYVLEELEQELGPTFLSSSITPLSRLVAVLRFMGEGGYQHGVGKDHSVGMAQSSFSGTLKMVLDILERRLCSVWIKLEMNDADKRQAKLDFYSKSRFPGVVMCIDGTHIKMIPPAEEKYLYYNRKGFYSINAMLICDSKMRIRFIDARYPGSNHDSHIWNLSSARTFFESKYGEGERNTWILGDSGYPLEPWLITPYRSPASGSNQSAFNKRHSRTRNIVERTIGVLKNRFRCILGARQLHYSPCKVAQIINVACALHNICIHFRDDSNSFQSETEEEDGEEEEEEEEADESSVVTTSTYRNVASRIRDNILSTLT